MTQQETPVLKHSLSWPHTSGDRQVASVLHINFSLNALSRWEQERGKEHVAVSLSLPLFLESLVSVPSAETAQWNTG